MQSFLYVILYCNYYITLGDVCNCKFDYRVGLCTEQTWGDPKLFSKLAPSTEYSV